MDSQSVRRPGDSANFKQLGPPENSQALSPSYGKRHAQKRRAQGHGRVVSQPRKLTQGLTRPGIQHQDRGSRPLPIRLQGATGLPTPYKGGKGKGPTGAGPNRVDEERSDGHKRRYEMGLRATALAEGPVVVVPAQLIRPAIETVISAGIALVWPSTGHASKDAVLDRGNG